MRRFHLVLTAALALLVVACGSSSSSSTKSSSAATTPSTQTSSTPTTSSVALATKTLSGVGTVLVNGQGRTLYIFEPDNAKKVTCVSACAAVWPPLIITGGQKPQESGGVKASLVSADTNPSGGQVVTYAGWPLYLYVADPSAGTDHGEGVNSSGGLWYVISPSGKVVKAASSSSSGGSAYGGSTY